MAKSLQNYFADNLDFEINEESRKQTGRYFYACIKNLENCKAKSSALAGCAIDAEELLRHYEMGERNFSEVFLEGGSFENLTLEPMNLSRSHISNLQFKNVVLKGVRIDHADINNVSLEHVDFSGSVLEYSRINHVTLKNSNFQGSSMSNAKLSSIIAEDSNLDEVNFDEVCGNWVDWSAGLRSKLTNCSLVRSKFRYSRLWGLDIQDSDLTEVDLTEAEVDIITLYENLTDIFTVEQLPRQESTGCRLPDGQLLEDFCSRFMAYLSENNVKLCNTVMPNGKIFS